MNKKILGLTILLGGLGYLGYERIIPSDKFSKAGKEVAELRSIFTNKCSIYWCDDDKYKKPEDIVQARREIIKDLGCKDKSHWRLTDRPTTACTTTDITDCKGLNVHPNWTLNSEGKFIPYGGLAYGLVAGPAFAYSFNESMACMPSRWR